MVKGIEALYRKPNTSKRHPGHPIYPYLLRGLRITRPDHVSLLNEPNGLRYRLVRDCAPRHLLRGCIELMDG